MKKTLFIIGLFFSFTLWAGPPRIIQIILSNGTHVPEAQIRALLTLHEGDPFDPDQWERSLSYLKKWGRFEEVRSDQMMMREGLKLRLTLKEGYLVSAIDLSGTYPFLSKRIRRLISIHAGDLYDPATVMDQIKKIVDFYGRQGFEGTEVLFKSRFNDPRGTVNLEYKIQKGKRYRIGHVTVLGATVFPHGWFLSKINPLFAYQPSRLKESLEKIHKGYQRAGYLRGRVRLVSLEKDHDHGQVNIVLEATEGDHVTVGIRGNQMISLRSLKKVMPIFTEGSTSSFDIEASERELLKLYDSRGFHRATVHSERKEGGKREIRISFEIHEGIQTEVKKIILEGNQEISDSTLKKKLATQEEELFKGAPFRPQTVERDFQNLPNLLHQEGALQGEATGHEVTFNSLKDRATVRFDLKEGPITRLASIRIVGNEAFPEKTLRKKLDLKEGNPFREDDLSHDKDALVQYYADRGYPYVVILHALEGDPSAATLTFQIQEGPIVRVGEVLIVGNERTRGSAMRSALRLKTGDPFSYRKLIQSETQLRRLGTFRSVNIETIGLAEKESVVHLLVKVEEQKSVVLDLEGSYDTDHFFTGATTLSHVNLFGYAKRTNLKLIGGRDLQRGETNLIDPFLLGYNLEGVLSGFAQHELRPGFDDYDVGGAVSFLHDFTPRLVLLERYQLTRTFFTNVTDPTGESEQNHTTARLTNSLSFDTRDSFADPSRGFISLGALDISHKVDGTGFDYLRPRGYVAYYLSWRRLTLLNFVRAEGIQMIGSNNTLARDQRLFLGGDYTIRGFDQDAVGPVGPDGKPAGGLLLLMHTAELQLRMFDQFKGALFVDSGSITNSFSELGTGSFRHSAGFGFRYVTPVGPLRVDYGFKLDQQPGESLGRLHFAFGYAF